MFKEKFKDLQHIVRELCLLRKHNKSFKEGDPQDTLLLFAEASLTILCLERFLRIIPEIKASEVDTLYNLLERALSKNILNLKTQDKEYFKKIVNVRNSILHGNFEQCARDYNLSSVEEYFKTQFASEIETLFLITDDLFKQIDPNTGKIRKKKHSIMRA